MKKISAVISLILCAVLMFASCAPTATQETTTKAAEATTAAAKEEIRIGLLKGPTGMGAAYLLENNSLEKTKAKYDVTLASAVDVLKASLINSELDIAALPTNVAAVLNGKTQGKIQILAVNTLGVIYLMSNTQDIAEVKDLKGKTILSAGQGTTTEYVLNYILEKNGLVPGEDVTVEFASEHAEVITKAKAGDYSVVLLPEPFVTQMKAQDSSFNTVIDLTKAWENAGGSLLTMGCVAVRSDFAAENPTAVAYFLADYKESVDYVNANTADAAALIEKFEIAKAAVAEKALPNCNITFMAGEEMKKNVSAYLNILAELNAQAVGGALPSDSFYYIAK